MISVISLISDSDYRRGQLRLALPFCCECGDGLPDQLSLHVKSGCVWIGKYVKGSFCIEGLEVMMKYYQLKPYYLAKLHYVGGDAFSVTFYTPYAIELKFPIVTDFLSSGGECAAVQVDRLCCTFNYNAKSNFVGLFNLQIQSHHLTDKPYTKVLCNYACYELGLTNSIKYIRPGFEDSEWKIKLKWVDGQALLSKNWLNFVQSAEVVPGDIVTICSTLTAFKFKAAIFDRKIVYEEALGADVSGNNTSWENFFKVSTFDSLDAAELELPRVFKNNYGYTLGDILHIELGSGYSTNFKIVLQPRRFMV
ncbi:uncharacterized protein LOC141706428 [Apium graveolens]|uniref:uncharacterized protein LOC141706428 n=1 Tax=Apium graveolens TaxID=4045 RepID=UPI003D79F25D